MTGEVVVAAGATLTIEPGVTVIFRGGLQVDGTLIAAGSVDAPIVITGWNNAPGSWDGIGISGVAGAPTTGHVLEHVTITNGGWHGANLSLTHAHATVRHATIGSSSNDGIRANDGASVDVSDSVFTDNRYYPIRVGDFAPVSHFARITATGNDPDRIAIGAGVVGAVRTLERALPYDLVGRITVPAGAELVVEPGVVLHAMLGGVFVDGGRITAKGTEAAPIVFTNTPTRTWDGLELRGTTAQPSTGSVLEWVVVENAGWHGANVVLTNAEVTISHAVIRGAGGDGIRGWGGGVAHVDTTTIADCRGYALRFDDGSMVPRLSALTVRGNDHDRIAFGAGEVTGVRTFTKLLPYDLLGALDVLAGAELVVEPGVEIHVEGGFVAHGKLTALGTPAEPILISSTVETPGSWDGLELRGTTAAKNTGSVLDYVTLEYGGWHGANLVLVDAEATVTNATFRHGSADGVRIGHGSNISLRASSFVDNRDYAVRFDDASATPDLAGLVASGNGADRIALAGATTSGVRVFDASLPYDLLGELAVPKGATVILPPGVVMRTRGGILVEGTLRALGTRTRPILFSVLGDARSWNGLRIRGAAGARNVGSTLDWVKMEYGGGQGGNLVLQHASARVTNSRFTNSFADGVRGNDAGGTIIEGSAFLENGGASDYAVRNETPTLGPPIYATNDWWGAPSGPTPGDTCNPEGGGARVSTGVVYRPFLTEDAELGPVAPLGAMSAELAPERWFLPADGATRAFVKITLRDESGLPVSGERVTLESTRGEVTGGGLTDVSGSVFAYVVSSEPGDAALTPVVASTSECRPIHAATSTITFVAGGDDEHFPDAEAPYFTSRLEWSERPLVQGRPVTVRARLMNPGDAPISVDAQFNYAQLGLGLTFGPVGTVTGQVIAAHSEGVLETTFVPPVSGHFCVQLDYSAQVTTKARHPKQGRARPLQSNNDAQSGSLSSGSENDAWERADTAIEASHAASLTITAVETVEHGVPPPSAGAEAAAAAHSSWTTRKWKEVTGSLGGNEGVAPRRKKAGRTGRALEGDDGSYRELPRALRVELEPLAASERLSARRAEAFNLWLRTYVDAIADLRAMALAAARNHAASEARDLEWASQQAAAVFFFKAKASGELVTFADATDALLSVMREEGQASYYLSAATWEARLAELRAGGFSDVEVSVAHEHGFADAEIGAARDALLASAPDDLAGDTMETFAVLGAAARDLGEALAAPPPIQHQVSGGLSTSSGNLARIYETVFALTAGNPRDTAATVVLRVRPIALPPTWTVVFEPSSQIELGPGESAPVVVHVLPGTPVAQGSIARFAVEGTIDGELIGGVVEELVVPYDVELGAGCTGDGAKPLGEACMCTIDCASGAVCAELDGAKVCRTSCELGGPATCPTGQACVTWSGPGGVCVTQPGPPPVEAADEGCGCTTTAAEARGGLALFVLVLVLVRRRR